MKTRILQILHDTLPNSFAYNVTESKNFDGSPYLKIWAAVNNIDINNVSGQKVQVVSLMLDLTYLDLHPQVFGGNGGQCIYRKPNLEDRAEKYLAMKSIKIPFRKPQPTEEKVLSAIRKFFTAYVQTLKDNAPVLMYQNLVNYSEILN